MKTKRNSRTKKMNVCQTEYFKLLAEHLKPAQVADLMFFYCLTEFLAHFRSRKSGHQPLANFLLQCHGHCLLYSL